MPDLPGEPPAQRRRSLWMVIKIIELRLRFIALMAVTGVSFAYTETLFNYYEKWTRPPGEGAASAGVESFCPMHPSVVQDQPGNCPICGMPLSRRNKGEAPELPPGVTARV